MIIIKVIKKWLKDNLYVMPQYFTVVKRYAV